MSAFSDYLEQQLLMATLCGQGFQAPAKLYLGLYTAPVPEGDAPGAELAGNGYTRTLIAFDAPVKNAAGNFTCASSSDIYSRVPAESDWGNISHFAIHDSPVGGNRLYHGALKEVRAIHRGDLFVVLRGDVKVTLE